MRKMLGHIVLSAQMENLFPLLEYTRGRFTERGFDAGTAARLELAMEEILVNIINYAYPDGVGEIEIGFGEENSDTIIEVRDWGIPFNPLERPDPDTGASLEDRGIGGLGIFFVRKIVDDASYRYEDGCNILTLTKRK